MEWQLLYLAVFRQIIGKSKVLFTFISKIIKNPAIMKINLQRIDDAFNMRATDELGHEVFMDSSVENGGKNKGVRPMAMLIMGMGGCAAIDVVMILKKQRQTIADLNIELNAEREKG